MLKKLMILPIAAGFLAVNAGAAVTPTVESAFNKTKGGCYEITNENDLFGFAAIVNNGNKTACAVVTSSISMTETWTPIMGFRGVFDGGYNAADASPITISGLKYNANSASVGLFGSVQGGALIRNVSIVNGSIAASQYVGGIVGGTDAANDASINNKSVVIDNCNYSGSVKGNENAGGLVGSIADNTKVTITNSYNTASVEKYSNAKNSDQGGLVGYVGSGATLDLVNCYSTGSASTNPLVGNSKGTITGKDVGCVTQKGTGLFDRNDDFCDNVVKSGVYSNSVPENVVANYESKLNNDDYQSENVRSSYDAAAIEAMLAPDLSGINFKDTTWTEGGIFRRKTYAITSSTLDDTAPLILPQSVTTDSVVLDRTFEVNVNSTVMLPFGIKANKAEGAKFFNITALSENDGVWSVTGEQEVDSIKPHTPYLVKPTATRIIFRGKVTLVATNAAKYSVNVNSNWSFCGLYETKQWLEGDGELGKDGQVYGYSSKADADRGIENGSFVRAGKNVRVKTMRGYLYYAVPRVAGALAKAAAVSLDDLPSSMVVELIEKELPPYVEEIVETIEPSVGEESEEDATQSIAKPVVAPEAVKANRWYDLNGRRLNKKPANHGSFYNKPVIVK